MSTNSTTRRRITVPIAIVLAVSSVPLLTGCFGNPIQGAINAATGGKVKLGSGSLPSDFPSDVPVYKGKIDTGLDLGSGKDEVWNVTVEVPGASAINDIKSELTSAGFKVEGSGSANSTTSGLIADTKKYDVLVGITKTDSKWVANYTVSPADSSSGN
ncbi:MAG TPA: hypothetical protein VHZ81_13970 [Galbitalea sp.]|nr:hypothetical protein [Galbitalea sp.]